jgi:hypothetical protein
MGISALLDQLQSDGRRGDKGQLMPRIHPMVRMANQAGMESVLQSGRLGYGW